MIRSIKAKGNMVLIKSDENGDELIGRREALMRARAIAGMDEKAAGFAESLILAADEAMKNETGGEGYGGEALEQFKLFLKAAEQDRLGKGIQV